MNRITLHFINSEELTFYLDTDNQVDELMKQFAAKTTKTIELTDDNQTYIFTRDNIAWIVA